MERRGPSAAKDKASRIALLAWTSNVLCSAIFLGDKFGYFIYVECMMSEAVLFSVAGHGMVVEAHPNADHWGRRLMASAPDNETEQKNCSEPGMLFYERETRPLVYY